MSDFRGEYCSLAEAQAAMEFAVQKEPGSLGTLRVSLLKEEGIPLSQTIQFPASWIRDRKELLVRCCATHLNNIAMTVGGTEIECACENRDLVAHVLGATDRLFPQVRQVLSEYCGRPISIRALYEDVTRGEARPYEPHPEFSDPPALGTAIGVNIGQTLTKIVAVRDGEELVHTRIVIPTWGEGCVRGFDNLFDRLTKTIHSLKESFDLGTPAIGVAVGGIVRDGRVTTRSGVAAQMPESDFPKFRSIAALLAQRFGTSTLLCQDVFAKAHAIKLAYPRNVLVLDIGTSTGGAFIAADGRLPDYVNQFGRVAIDISNAAVPRDDGQARGILSKYLSVAGYERLCRDRGLAGLTPDTLVSLADAGDPRATRLVAQLFKILLDALRILNRYYDASVVVLTGGFVQTQLGMRLVERVNRFLTDAHDRLPPLVTSTNPLFEGAIGAARIASMRAGAIDLIPVEIRRLLADAEAGRDATAAPFGTPADCKVPMDSPLGRNHYINYNAHFIRRYIAHATADETLRDAITAKLIPEVSDLKSVGALTPQQVQTAAVRAIARATGRYDPFLSRKRSTNLAVMKVVRPLASWLEKNLKQANQIDDDSAAVLKAFLTISGLLNACDFFHPDVQDNILQALYSDRTALQLGDNPWLQSVEELTTVRASSLITLDEFEAFHELLRRNSGGIILYFLDNAGEVVVDLFVAEILLARGFGVVLVAGRDPFVDDVTVAEVHALVHESATMRGFAKIGRLQLASADSDMVSWDDTLLMNLRSAAGFISKGMRKLGQLYYLDWPLCGLHVTLNKSETIREILRRDRAISLAEEDAGKVVLVYSAKN